MRQVKLLGRRVVRRRYGCVVMRVYLALGLLASPFYIGAQSSILVAAGVSGVLCLLRSSRGRVRDALGEGRLKDTVSSGCTSEAGPTSCETG